MLILRLVLLTLSIASGVMVTGGAAPAFACSCAYQRTPDFVNSADEIFAGTLVSMVEPPAQDVMSSTDPITYTVAVDAVYRGVVGSAAVFESAMSGASCGLEGMVLDRRYLIFVNANGSVRTANLCGGTALATPGRVKAVERHTGAPTQPAVVVDEGAAASSTVVRATGDDEPAQRTMSRWTIGIAGLVGTAALVGAGLSTRRRAIPRQARHR